MTESSSYLTAVFAGRRTRDPRHLRRRILTRDAHDLKAGTLAESSDVAMAVLDAIGAILASSSGPK